jgi:hypothetical protein
MKAQDNLFGEKVIRIKGDDYLNKIAQHIYDLVTREPELLSGDSMNAIYRQVQFAMMIDNGLTPIIQSGDKDKFKAWFLSRECPTEEETARAARGLLEADLIRLPAKVIKRSEQFKNRIAGSLH